MVTPRSHRSRAQLILIGAITLAFIILGIVVVFNGVLYTETISTSSASQSTADADVIDRGLERNLVDIAHRVNLNGDLNSNDFDDEIAGNFTDQYRETTANSRSAIVDIRNVETTEKASVRTDESLDNTTIDLGNESVGYLNVKVVNADGTGKLTINATREDGTNTEITLEEIGNSYVLSAGGTSCDISEDQASIDLVTGAVNVSGDDCGDLELLTRSDDYNNIEITREPGFDGRYVLVAEHGSDDGVWKIEADIAYESNEVSYERTDSTIEIYGESG